MKAELKIGIIGIFSILLSFGVLVLKGNNIFGNSKSIIPRIIIDGLESSPCENKWFDCW